MGTPLGLFLAGFAGTIGGTLIGYGLAQWLILKPSQERWLAQQRADNEAHLAAIRALMDAFHPPAQAPAALTSEEADKWQSYWRRWTSHES